MAQDCSFDVVSHRSVSQSLDNAVNQAMKEIGQRYDFKGAGENLPWKRQD